MERKLRIGKKRERDRVKSKRRDSPPGGAGGARLGVSSAEGVRSLMLSKLALQGEHPTDFSLQGSPAGHRARTLRTSIQNKHNAHLQFSTIVPSIFKYLFSFVFSIALFKKLAVLALFVTSLTTLYNNCVLSNLLSRVVLYIYTRGTYIL